MKNLITAAKGGGWCVRFSSEKDEGLECSYKTHDVSYLAISQSYQLQKGRGSNTAFTYLEIFKDKEAMALTAVAWKYFSTLALSGSAMMLRRPEAYKIFQLFINIFLFVSHTDCWLISLDNTG